MSGGALKTSEFIVILYSQASVQEVMNVILVIQVVSCTSSITTLPNFEH